MFTSIAQVLLDWSNKTSFFSNSGHFLLQSTEPLHQIQIQKPNQQYENPNLQHATFRSQICKLDLNANSRFRSQFRSQICNMIKIFLKIYLVNLLKQESHLCLPCLSSKPASTLLLVFCNIFDLINIFHNYLL